MKLRPRIIVEALQTSMTHFGDSNVKPDLILIVFDTAAIARRNERHDECLKFSCPAKYAVRWHQGWDDSGIVAQDVLYDAESNAKAEWFNEFYDLPVAIQALREHFPDKEIPDQVSYVIDWPFRRGAFEPGASLIKRVAQSA